MGPLPGGTHAKRDAQTTNQPDYANFLPSAFSHLAYVRTQSLQQTVFPPILSLGSACCRGVSTDPVTGHRVWVCILESTSTAATATRRNMYKDWTYLFDSSRRGVAVDGPSPRNRAAELHVWRIRVRPLCVPRNRAAELHVWRIRVRPLCVPHATRAPGKHVRRRTPERVRRARRRTRLVIAPKPGPDARRQATVHQIQTRLRQGAVSIFALSKSLMAKQKKYFVGYIIHAF